MRKHFDMFAVLLVSTLLHVGGVFVYIRYFSP